MAREKNDNVEVDYELEPQEEIYEEVPELSIEEMQEMKEEQEDDEADNREDQAEESMELSQEMQEQYGSPEPDEQHSTHTVIDRALFKSPETLKLTFLHESELGRPLFSVRFLLDLQKAAAHSSLERISHYYKNKVENITGSGMSNKGFMMNLNVTRRKDMTRRREREISVEPKK